MQIISKMKLQSFKRTFVISGAIVLLVGSPVNAHDGESYSSPTQLKDAAQKVEDRVRATINQIVTVSPGPKAEDQKRNLVTDLKNQLETRRNERQAALDNKKAELNRRLDNAKKKVCEKNQAKLNSSMGEMDKRRQNTFTRIAQIADSTESFYINKRLSISNYEMLLAAVNTTEAEARLAMNAQLAVPNLDCNGTHPRFDIENFRSKRLDSVDAMKAYRDAVKALVQAVKSAVDEAKRSGTTS